MRTLENAIIADKILAHINSGKSGHYYSSSGLQEYVFTDLDVNHIEFIIGWIKEDFGKYAKIEKSNNGKGNYIIQPNDGTALFLKNGGIESIIKKEIDSNKIKEETAKYDLVTKKWYYKTRLVPYLISFISFIVSCSALFVSIKKENREEKKQEKELKQQEIKNEPLNTKDTSQIKHN